MDKEPPNVLDYQVPPTVRPQLSKRAQFTLIVLLIVSGALLILSVIA
jgi:hypothetical protein